MKIACVILLMLSLNAIAEVTLTPRVAYYFDNTNQRTSLLDDVFVAPDLTAEIQALQAEFGPDASIQYGEFSFGTEADQYSIPMFGGSASFGNDERLWTLTLMYGESDAKEIVTGFGSYSVTIGGITSVDILGGIGDNESDVKRIDVEGTMQQRINERFSLMVGLRYERIETENELGLVTLRSVNEANLTSIARGGNVTIVDVLQDFSFSSHSTSDETYSLRIGMSAFAPFGERGIAFVTGMIQASYLQSKIDTIGFKDANEFSLGPDISVGLQFSLTERVSVDARYRMTAFFPLSGGFSTDDPRVAHGVSLGVSTTF